jgi:hypothetical protein
MKNYKIMKTLKTFNIIALIFFFIMSCGTDIDIDRLPPMEIEIPDELKDNKEMVKIIEDSEVAFNEFTVELDDFVYVAVELDLENKDMDELDFMDKAKVVTASGGLWVKFNTVVQKYDMIKRMESVVKDTLSAQEIKAIETISRSFKKRMDELDSKYKKMKLKKFKE